MVTEKSLFGMWRTLHFSEIAYRQASQAYENQQLFDWPNSNFQHQASIAQRKPGPFRCRIDKRIQKQRF
jgi:hypothetical protein